MPPTAQNSKTLENWLDQHRAALQAAGLSNGDLAPVEQAAAALRQGPRQRILYIHAATPSLASHILTCNEWGTTAAERPEVRTEVPEFPYQCVHDAVLDGWQVIHFPNQLAPFDDREIDILGYEFILQKLEYETALKATATPATPEARYE